MALQKYEPVAVDRGDHAEMAPSPSGEYVRLEDVRQMVEGLMKPGASAADILWDDALIEVLRRLSDTPTDDTPRED